MTMANFLLIGAGKSGTTSLYYLKQHPEVYMSPIKGPKFFAFEGREPDFRGPPSRNTVTDLEAYRVLFAAVADETAVGVSGESKEVSESSSFGDASTLDRAL